MFLVLESELRKLFITFKNTATGRERIHLGDCNMNMMGEVELVPREWEDEE